MRLARGAGALAAAIGLTAGGGLAGSQAAADPVREGARMGVLRGTQEPGAITSSNWAGYAVAAGAPASPPPPSVTATFTSVTGTWKQPNVSCTGRAATYSGIWVGIGGFERDAQALEQIGTAAGCDRAARPVYYAWYELVPAPSVRLDLKIAPGDTITTSVNVSGTSVLLQIKNRSRRTSVTKQLTMAAPDLSSAEWIVEAPSGCTSNGGCRTLPLANFGSVGFTRIAVIGDAHPGTVTDPAWTARQIQLIPDAPALESATADGSMSGATPAGLTPDGRSFTVSWQARAAPAVAR